VRNVISTTTTTARRRRDVCVRSVVSGIVLPCAYYTDVYIMVTRHTRIAMLVVRPSPVSPVGNGFLISAIVVTAAQQIYIIYVVSVIIRRVRYNMGMCVMCTYDIAQHRRGACLLRLGDLAATGARRRAEKKTVTIYATTIIP